ncbi:MAG: hypothetical protein ABR975_13420 [Vulcanimicrobiaceae bacterium]
MLPKRLPTITISCSLGAVAVSVSTMRSPVTSTALIDGSTTVGLSAQSITFR